MSAVGGDAVAQSDDDLRPATVKRLSLEQLADLEITSVSGRAMPLSLAPSAIDVITAEDIRRSGVTNIPDSLRLATGLHVAQVDGHTWAISARGFNPPSATANKLQVLMDGRVLYTPLFSGVFWDVQHTFLPDIEQIEVIRGPGATLWGANAVNGVINIRSKSAAETQGFLFHAGAGIEEEGFAGLRYGGRSGDTYYRVYATHRSHDDLTLEATNADAGDPYGLTQGGFRIDSQLGPDDSLTVQGDIYTGRFGQLIGNDVEAQGGNILTRWTRRTGPDSSLQLLAYYDRSDRLIPGVFDGERDTFDIEFQHQFPLGEVHQIVWGLAARASTDRIDNQGPGLAFLPDSETLYLFSGFVQDEIQVMPDVLALTLGSKFEHNSFSQFEVQPTARVAWTPTSKQTVWAAVSRAVRTPTRIDQDLFAPNPAFLPPVLLQGNRNFDAEELIAYELGYRAEPVNNVTTDLALFYHDYDNLRSMEPVGAAAPPFMLSNLLQGESYGAELAVNWQPTNWWQLDVGYTLMQSQFRAKPGSRDTSGGRAEGNDPNHMVVARSAFDLPRDFTADAIVRYVDRLPMPQTPAYTTVDLRFAWQPTAALELAIVGRNLLDKRHPEYRGATTREIGRSVYFTVTWEF